MTVNSWDLTRSEHKLEELAAAVSDVGRRAILILTHNNPDPDGIASALGFQFLLKKKFGIRGTIGHGGVVTRAENKAMISRLHIKMRQLTRCNLSDYHSLALVDAQPGTGNNLVDPGTELPQIVIDHHPLRKLSLRASVYDIRPRYGATSTIITELIRAAGLTPNRSLANALLYGIKTDTNSLLRGASEVDLQAFNYLSPMTNPRVLAWIGRPALPPEYFIDYHRGLSQARLYRDVAVSYLGEIQSEAIVPELADVLLRIEGVRWSLCIGRIKRLMILSLRSTAKKIGAGSVIRRLVGKSGSAGGHSEMAGGQVPLQELNKSEIEDFVRDLIDRFLVLIDREGAQPRSLVEPE
jgi:nanoRNase/pAp phosphatase (c-di-AMP/oligoRNAs hydrolase)